LLAPTGGFSLNYDSEFEGICPSQLCHSVSAGSTSYGNLPTVEQIEKEREDTQNTLVSAGMERVSLSISNV
jgi:hypothetical protein